MAFGSYANEYSSTWRSWVGFHNHLWDYVRNLEMRVESYTLVKLSHNEFVEIIKNPME